jgi:hypothetical protein
MCHFTVKTELQQLKFAVSSLAAMCGTPGSHEKENAENVARGIRARLDWCLDVIDNNRPLIGDKSNPNA